MSLIQTRASLANSQSLKSFEYVKPTAQSMLKRTVHVRKNKNKMKYSLKNDVDNVFNMDKAKKEIADLALAGFEENDYNRAVKKILVQLGAKPQKKKYINYKLLQNKIKEDKAVKEQAEKEKHDRLVGVIEPKVKKVSKKEKEFKKRTNILASYRDGFTKVTKKGHIIQRRK